MSIPRRRRRSIRTVIADLQSAIAFEKQGYKTIGTSSAAVANSLGLEDGEQMSFEQHK